jgi:hypothetical protein
MRESREEAIAVIREAIDSGINYMDAIWAYPDYRDMIGVALKGRRDRVLLTGHLGANVISGQSGRTREPAEALIWFEDFLRRAGTDRADVAMIHYVQDRDDYRDVIEGGLLDLAERLKRDGGIRLIGLSAHSPDVLLPAIHSGRVDLVMAPVNLCWCPDGVPEACEASGTGLIAMKPYHGGWFFHKPYSDVITPAAALNYALSRPGVSTVLAGVKNRQELYSTLAAFDATDEDRDFSHTLASLPEKLYGTCVYCEHCLPCTAGIEISQVTQSLDLFDRGENSASWYQSLRAKASACTECGVCLDRCPLKVDILAYMKRAVKAFGV